MRKPWLIGIALVLSPPAWALGLYEASTIVTGMDQRSRPAGLAQTLGQVLAKVSGNPDLVADARLAAVDPLPMLRNLAYLDRMSDQLMHDEQGSRDRPFDLIARYDPAAIDALLHSWNQPPWPLPRPTLAIAIRIHPRIGPEFPLHGDTHPDERHRAALLAAADRFGLALTLPLTLGAANPPPGAPVLSGALSWSDADAGWSGQWHLTWHGAEHAWGLPGVGFDAAYRDALAGAARILSGHQNPAR